VAPDPTQDLFWRLAADHLRRPGVERSTMMGFPCLRAHGLFYACPHRHTGELIVKLPEARVRELVSAGVGSEFKPAGKVFREWLAISQPDEELWRSLLEEARRFAVQSAAHPKG
jgi:hypothetical protein